MSAESNLPIAKKYGEYRISSTSLGGRCSRATWPWPPEGALPHGFLDPAIYRLAGAIDPGHPARLLDRLRLRRDSNDGINKKDGTSVTLRTADMDTSLHTKKGYDDVTGLGAPRGAHLLKALRHR